MIVLEVTRQIVVLRKNALGLHAKNKKNECFLKIFLRKIEEYFVVKYSLF